MDAQQRRGVLAAHVAHHERDGLFEAGAPVGEAEAAFETVNTERAVFGGKVGFGRLDQFETIYGRNNFIIMNRQA